MSVVVLVEVEDGRASLVSREALTFARSLGAGDLHAVVVGPAADAVVADCREAGVAVVHAADDPALERYAAAAWAAVVEAAGPRRPGRPRLAPGTGRGNEVLAHVAARRSLRMAANVVAVESLDPLVVQRQVVGGAALERATVASRVRLLTMAGHAVEPTPADAPGRGPGRAPRGHRRPPGPAGPGRPGRAP